MNMKKTSILLVSVILAASSAFAWSKKSENTGNLGRMYMSIAGGVQMNKATMSSGVIPPAGAKSDPTSTPTGADASFVINAPIFKPGVNAFKNIKWAGVDGQVFFDYNYSGEYKANYVSGVSTTTELSNTSYSVGAALIPYLNFDIDLPFLQAVKPFGMGFVAFEWSDTNATSTLPYLDGLSDSYSAFKYGVGAGVEFVILDELSFTPYWKWVCSTHDSAPCVQHVGAELAYWFTDQFCVSVFWNHSFGGVSTSDFDGDYYSLDMKHGDIIGAKFKIGFMR